MLQRTTQRFARAAALTALLGLGGLLTGTAHAQTFLLPVYSTGQTSVYSASPQTQYVTGIGLDTQWTVSAVNNPGNSGTSIVTTPNTAWLANDGNSKWISNVFNSNGIAGNGSSPGAYTFQTSFVMPSNVDLSTAYIKFIYAADNRLTSVSVNSGAAAPGISGGGFGSFSSEMTLNNSNANFIAGTNTLTFTVQNDPDTNAVNPMGLRVQFTDAKVSMQGAAAPEPASVALVALGGLPAIGIVARRRRNKA